MNYIFQPKNFFEAFALYRDLPLYTWNQAKKREPILFPVDSITQVEQVWKTRHYIIQYKTERFSGYFRFSSLPIGYPESDIPSVKRPFPKGFLLYYYKQHMIFSPAMVMIISAFAAGWLYRRFAQPIVKSIWPEEAFVNAICDAQCVIKAVSMFNLIGFSFAIFAVPLLVVCVLYRWRLPKIRHGLVYRTFQLESVMAVFLVLWVALALVFNFSKNNGLDRVTAQYELLYHGQTQMSSTKLSR